MVLNAHPGPNRILIAGTGSIGRRHITNLRTLLPDARYAFLRAAGRQDELSTELRAEVVANMASALAWEPTLAVVATPSNLHANALLPLLRAGVPVFIEKPIVTREEDVVELERLGASNPLPPTQVGCVLRFLPSLRMLKRWLEEGRLGRVVRASFEVGQWLPDWRPAQDYRRSYSAQRTQGGGVVFDLIHEIDLACWFFGRPHLLGAWGAHLSRLEIETEDVATLMLRSDTGEQICIQLDYVCRSPVRLIHIVGDEASVVWDLPQRSMVLTGSGGRRDQVTDGFDTGAAYVEAMRELVENGARPTSLPLIEGLPATRLAIRANEMIRGIVAP